MTQGNAPIGRSPLSWGLMVVGVLALVVAGISRGGSLTLTLVVGGIVALGAGIGVLLVVCPSRNPAGGIVTANQDAVRALVGQLANVRASA